MRADALIYKDWDIKKSMQDFFKRAPNRSKIVEERTRAQNKRVMRIPQASRQSKPHSDVNSFENPNQYIEREESVHQNYNSYHGPSMTDSNLYVDTIMNDDEEIEIKYSDILKSLNNKN